MSENTKVNFSARTAPEAVSALREIAKLTKRDIGDVLEIAVMRELARCKSEDDPTGAAISKHAAAKA